MGLNLDNALFKTNTISTVFIDLIMVGVTGFEPPTNAYIQHCLILINDHLINHLPLYPDHLIGTNY